jgi:PTS system galactitol-specific IIA component
MNAKNMISGDLISVGARAEDARGAISLCSRMLERHGYVKPSFLDAVLLREESYPTGIPMPYVGLAIPHCDPSHVEFQGVSLAVLSEPVIFQSMEDPEETIPVEFVFCLAVKRNDDNVKLLPKIIKIFAQRENVLEIKRLKTSASVQMFLQNRMDAMYS